MPAQSSPFFVPRDRAEEIRKQFGSYYHYLKGFCAMRRLDGDRMALGEFEAEDARIEALFALIERPGSDDEEYYLATMLLINAFAPRRSPHAGSVSISAIKNFFDKLVFERAHRSTQNTQNTPQKA